MNVKVETVGVLESGPAKQGPQMEGVGSVVGGVTSGADRDGLEGQSGSFWESLLGALKLTAFWE